MKEKIKNFILNLNIVRRNFGYMMFKSLFFKKLKLKIDSKSPRGRVLVLAPHPDDETFGCGGAVKWHTLQRDPVKVIFLTSAKNKRKTQKRKNEAQLAAKILGVKDLTFWNNHDGQLSADQKTANDLAKVIKLYRPKIIYVPSFLDPHQDHFNTAKILAKSLASIKYNSWIFCYEIWSPVYVNRLIIIDKVLSFKKRAIKVYESQLKDRPYLEAILGLNKYRAKMFGISNFAEGFFVCDTRVYLKLFKRLGR